MIPGRTMTEVAHSVLLAEEDGQFCVTVLPTPEGVGHDRCFIIYLEARTYARLLRFGHGWKLIDRCDKAVKHGQV